MNVYALNYIFEYGYSSFIFYTSMCIAFCTCTKYIRLVSMIYFGGLWWATEDPRFHVALGKRRVQ